MRRSLRLACLGDSWVSSPEDDGTRCTAMPVALQAGLQARGFEVELIIAGFPGCTTERLIDLCQICRLRDMAVLSQRGCSIKNNIVARLESQGIPFLADAYDTSAVINEDVDIVVIAVGSNDLCRKSESAEILARLFKLWRLYTERGVEVLMVSLGGNGPSESSAWPDLERDRSRANARLLKEDFVLNIDELLHDVRFNQSLWSDDGWHLNKEGSAIYGDRLAECMAKLFASNKVSKTLGLSHTEADLLCLVDGCDCNEIGGLYLLQGINHGRPAYKKLTGKSNKEAWLFFWDDRNGKDWSGWWLGPEIGWDYPGWAHHDDVESDVPPFCSWTIPPRGPASETFRLSLSSPEALLELSGHKSGGASALINVSTCQDPSVSNIISGVYAMQGVNHGKPMYKKRNHEGATDVVVFFWDARDGPRWSGWWFGPKLGWDHQGWARHEEKISQTPPCSGWKVPAPNGVVDLTLQLSYASTSMAKESSASDPSQTDVEKESSTPNLPQEEIQKEPSAPNLPQVEIPKEPPASDLAQGMIEKELSAPNQPQGKNQKETSAPNLPQGEIPKERSGPNLPQVELPKEAICASSESKENRSRSPRRCSVKDLT